jgi:hypothetical protein
VYRTDHTYLLVLSFRKFAFNPKVGCDFLLHIKFRFVENISKETLKVHKHEIFFNFLLTQIKSLYALGKFSEKISLSFLRFSPEFRSSNIYAVTEHTRNQIFFERYPKKFFLKIFTMVLLDRLPAGFSKF